MAFIKANWKQGLTIALSVATFALLHTKVITIDQAGAAGAVLALVGIHLEPVTYGGES